MSSDEEQADAGLSVLHHSELLPIVKRFYPRESEEHLTELMVKIARVYVQSKDIYADAEAYLQRRSKSLSLARRLYKQHNERYITERSEELALVSNEEYSFYEISCSVCRMFGSTGHHRREILIKSLSENCHFCDILRKCQRHFASHCTMMQVCFQGDGGDKQICFREDFAKDKCRDVHVQLYSNEPRIQPSPFPYMRDFDEDAGSQVSIDVMKEWIDRCHTTHGHALPGHDRKPTRLIKLSKNEELGARICSPEKPIKFAALSYRWGMDAQSATLRENVDERYKKLITSDFPKTLQDAIHVTRGLGLEYIWIDRICIIQDDGDDWAKEASLMADIYETAHVVLSATATEDCRDGFLKRSSKSPLLIRYTQRGQGSCEVRARQTEGHNCDGETPKINYSLLQRGWCMQERYLARRTIHFLPDEIVFQCEDGRECECGAASKEDMYYDDYEGLDTFTSLRSAPNMDAKGHAFEWEWMVMVSDYSKMNLTYGDDTLPALSGLAACIQHLKPGKYIAGLWQHEIIYQLGWCVEPGPGLRRWKFPQDGDLLGPTFSWSSHVRPIGQGYGRNTQCISALESFHVDLATPNPYGKVRHASITLGGPVVAGHDLISWLKTSDNPRDTAYVHLDSGLYLMVPFLHRNATNDAQYEEFENGIDWDSVICFGLYECGNWQTMQVDVLLLQPSATDREKYVRIGLVRELWKIQFYETAVARTVTIG